MGLFTLSFHIIHDNTIHGHTIQDNNYVDNTSSHTKSLKEQQMTMKIVIQTHKEIIFELETKKTITEIWINA